MPHLKIFLMTKNEIGMLEDWIIYHGSIFGYKNLYILDGSDDPRVFEIYDRYANRGINIFFSTTSLDGLARELTELMHSHKGENNFLIKLDTDEFLAYAKPRIFPTNSCIKEAMRGLYIKRFDGKPEMEVPWLFRLLVERQFNLARLCNANFPEFLSSLPINGKRYKASIIVWSNPSAGESSRPCREISLFTVPQFSHLKSFFHSDSFVSVDLGSHAGQSTDNHGFNETDLTIIHYHSTSVEDAMRRARQVLISHKYISEGLEEDEEIRILKELQGKVSASRHKLDLYLRYLTEKESGVAISVESLNEDHPFYRKRPYQRNELVKGHLEKILL